MVIGWTYKQTNKHLDGSLVEQTDGDGRKNWRSGERTDKQLDRLIDEQTDRLDDLKPVRRAILPTDRLT